MSETTILEETRRFLVNLCHGLEISAGPDPQSRPWNDVWKTRCETLIARLNEVLRDSNKGPTE